MNAATLGFIVFLFVIALYFLIRIKLAKPPDYTDAVKDVLDTEPDIMMAQYQEFIARQDMDFRAGR